MPPQTTVEPTHSGTAPAVPAAAPGATAPPPADAGMDLSQSAEVRASLDNLGNIAARANELARTAEDSAAENPEAAHDAARAREAADMALAGQADILRAARRGDRGAVTRVINRTIGNAQTMVDNVSEEVGTHSPAASEGAKRIAKEAETDDRKEQAQRSQSARSSTHARRERHPVRRPAAPPLVDEPHPLTERERRAGRNAANIGDALAQAAAAADIARRERRERPRSRDDDSAPEAFRVRRAGESRETAQRRTAVRRSTYDVARVVGILDDHGAETAQRLETGIAQAQSEPERQYYERERGDAINRRLFGDTFIHQEFRDAAAGLARLGYGGLSDTEIANRLIANGAMVDGYSNWGPFNAASNAQWSDRNVRRLDRNGDGQLSAQEIAYALRKGAEAVREMERYRAQNNPITIATNTGIDMARDAAALRTPLGRQLNAILGELQTQVDKNIFDADRDGRVELHELVERMRSMGITSIQDVGARGIHRADVAATYDRARNRPGH